MPVAKPDIVITDRESKQKCSIEPLRGRSDLLFFSSENINSISPETFSGYIFLHVDGPPLSPEDENQPFLLLDASWKRALKLAQLPIFNSLVKRSLVGFNTSYPRVSKIYPLPNGGLASVEALYAARLIQGRASLDLFDHYYWKQAFLQANEKQLQEWQEFWQKRNTSIKENKIL